MQRMRRCLFAYRGSFFFLGFRGLPSNPLHDPPLFDLERGRADG